MEYEKVVDTIQRVTHLHQVPVIFRDTEANHGGSPYFGLGEHCWKVWEEVGMELIDNPMFELVDFIQNRHLQYYHVGLPNEILEGKSDHLYSVTEKQLRENGIQLSLTKSMLEIFVILHEFGHAHQLYVTYQGNLEKYLADTQEESERITYRIRAEGLAGTEEGLWLHKSASTEKYADAFAMKHFLDVLKKTLPQAG